MEVGNDVEERVIFEIRRDENWCHFMVEISAVKADRHSSQKASQESPSTFFATVQSPRCAAAVSIFSL